MRPRSRLLTKKKLPTICEAYEEILQDKNDSNKLYIHSDSLSSEDYLQSICQLAQPTFPVLENNICEVQSSNRLNSQKQAPHLPRLPPLASPPTPMHPYLSSCLQGTLLSDIISLEGVSLTLNKNISPLFRPDPLEQLYGHRDTFHLKDSKGQSRFSKTTREHVITMPRKNSCPELTLEAQTNLDSQCAPGTPSNKETSSANLPGQVWPCPPKENNLKERNPKTNSRRHHSLVKIPEELKTKGSSAAVSEENLCSSQSEFPEKHGMIYNWITDCRSAWKEARVTACMLPAIAEM
ncbi:uncharacterized protein si:dkeyp-72g9.4 [Polyodon spathula]|uniref:uncharacterized protein si:dkeyp-72g9.4 n=1 Tax=Polyodon spathula TaxID=7913 RepID=UPI001B7E3107|nr:uncharacterized protein si:dkeyp-72g9.4 [Polyodon spathula]XP_041078900.1 uncharacterized protein si:dkeyp-72g9.4 [Polyodon spathula]